MTSNYNLLNLSKKERKELLELLELQSAFIGIFSKSVAVMKGLNDLETSLWKKVDDTIQKEETSE